MKGSNDFVDQWDLIMCGIQAVKYTAEHANSTGNYVGKVYMEDPNFQHLVFALPVPCIACGKLISKEVEALSAKEADKERERKGQS